MWHVQAKGNIAATADAGLELVLDISTHVDDLKGAGKEFYNQKLIEELETAFGKLKLKWASFECIGVMHEQKENTFEATAHQQHYVPQINQIELDSIAFARDEDPADDDVRQLYMSLVGALAWLILSVPAICVYVAFLQRHGQAPTY